MTKDQIEQKIAELHEKVFALQKEIEEVERESVKMEDTDEWPVAYDSYFYITRSGEIVESIFKIFNCTADLNTKSIGNCFRSPKQAKFAVERLKVLAEMRKFAFKPNLNKGSLNWYIGFDKEDCKVKPLSTPLYLPCNIFYQDWETTTKCINAIGEERLKKYYFGVKDDE